ncbi:MAG: hypothetical protein K0Q66_29 [Chitinophagaceae bacterium]|jgi:hypothetical protein|nr:hypothetical protein [Chitinophagaceae bacterium]
MLMKILRDKVLTKIERSLLTDESVRERKLSHKIITVALLAAAYGYGVTIVLKMLQVG